MLMLVADSVEEKGFIEQRSFRRRASWCRFRRYDQKSTEWLIRQLKVSGKTEASVYAWLDVPTFLRRGMAVSGN